MARIPTPHWDKLRKPQAVLRDSELTDPGDSERVAKDAPPIPVVPPPRPS